jgi:hypothetical protein
MQRSSPPATLDSSYVHTVLTPPSPALFQYDSPPSSHYFGASGLLERPRSPFWCPSYADHARSMSWIIYLVGCFSGVHRWPVLGVPRGQPEGYFQAPLRRFGWLACLYEARSAHVNTGTEPLSNLTNIMTPQSQNTSCADASRKRVDLLFVAISE